MSSLSRNNHLLYNGVSDRSRGWKTRRADTVAEEFDVHNPHVMKWDGASRSSSNWDGLRRDPELWCRNGDCYIHLYPEGQSRRGPAFRVPFSLLVQAKCTRLVEQFMSQNFFEQPMSPAAYHDSATSPHQSVQRVDIYIPAPATLNKEDAFEHHVATRNFFAFILRKSLVGESLGVALISVMARLQEYRAPGAPNAEDLEIYMQEEGYLDFANHPTHALAALHLAEKFQLRDLYIDAFAHCCGMSDQLFLVPEYQLLSSASRKQIRCSRADMDSRISQATSMLSAFLQDELSEAYLGLNPGARAHLERFRTLLQGVYAAQFGYYPPPIDSQTSAFQLDIFLSMKKDFEALYNYLVDESFDPSKGSPPSAQGGICALQSVQGFDTRHNFQTLDHPLPLCPEISQQTVSKRRPWNIKARKATMVQTYAAVSRATNQSNPQLLNNPLVRAYRRFEEDSIYCPMKADKLEDLNAVDARKVRWILIYTIYQTLRQAAQPPPEVRESETLVPYHMSISTTNLPPWSKEQAIHSLVCSPTEASAPMISMSGLPRMGTGWTTPVELSRPPSPVWDIEPDIDYLALAQRDDDKPELPRTHSGTFSICPRLSIRRNSITNNTTLALRSLKLFTLHQPDTPVTSPRSRRSSYHEIMTRGYGNGMKDVESTSLQERRFGSTTTLPSTASLAISTTAPTTTSSTTMTPSTISTSRSASTSSKSSNHSLGSAASTTATSLTESSIIMRDTSTSTSTTPCRRLSTSSTSSWHTLRRNNSARQHQLPGTESRPAPMPRCMSMLLTPSRPPQHQQTFTIDDERAGKHSMLPPPKWRGLDRRPWSSVDWDMGRRTSKKESRRQSSVVSHGILDDDVFGIVGGGGGAAAGRSAWDELDVRRGGDDRMTEEVEEEKEEKENDRKEVEDDVKPFWDSYNDLGGFTEMKSSRSIVPVQRASTFFV